MRTRCASVLSLFVLLTAASSPWLVCRSHAQMTMADFDPVGDHAVTNFCEPTPQAQAITAEIASLTMNDPADVYTGGVMTIAGGQQIVLPANLVIDLPANRMTLRQLFDQAPPACLAAGESGLASSDTCLGGAPGATANVLANLTSGFQTIAGEVLIEKGPGAPGIPADKVLTGIVTSINFDQGYFVVNGIPGQPGVGTIVRINDPDSIHTIQLGAGCDPTMPNCSADIRFGLDTENYTNTFSTGYPLCIPSTVAGGLRTTGANSVGTGDPFCPQTNRPADPLATPVPDSTRFAPVHVGDNVTAEGNFERIGGVTFFSAHTTFLAELLQTRDDPTQPDYMIFDEAGWDAPGFANDRVRLLLIGFSTLPDSQLDVYSLHRNGVDNTDHLIPLASTVGNPNTTCLGLGGAGGVGCTFAAGGGIWKIVYDVDFLAGVKPSRSPCAHLANAGLIGSSLCSLAEEVSVLSPIAREVQAFTRHGQQLLPGIETHNINGLPATNGQYLTPMGIDHQEFVEINLGALPFPYMFTGEPWLMDRRLGVGGCDDATGCESFASAPLGTLALNPFPFSGIDPRTVSLIGIPAGAENFMFRVWPFGPTDFVLPTPPNADHWPPLPQVMPPPLVCEDNNPCTTNGCDPATGCTFVPVDGAACDDGDLCTTGDVCSGGACVGTPVPNCTCGLLGITGPAQLAAPGQTMTIDVSIDTATPLGAYSFNVTFDPATMRLDSVSGGTTFEFSAPPLCNINNTAGTALCASTQSLSLNSPTGVVSIARLNMTVLGTSTGSGTVGVSVNSLFSATAAGGGIQPCNVAQSLTLSTTCGDLSGDGAITIADALLVAQIEVQLRQCNDPAVQRFDACDINPAGGAGDGLCNIGDALKIAQCNVGLIPCTFQCTPLACVPPGP